MAILEAPMAGKILQVNVKPGDAVHDGDEVVILESMKMEIPVMAEDDGVVSEVLAEAGKEVMAGAPLVKF